MRQGWCLTQKTNGHISHSFYQLLSYCHTCCTHTLSPISLLFQDVELSVKTKLHSGKLIQTLMWHLQLFTWKAISWSYVFSGNDWKNTTAWCQRDVIYTVCLFPSAKRRRGSNPVLTSVSSACKNISWRFFPSSVLDNHTNWKHAWLPHCSSCRYIQALTSAVCSPNMCTRPGKPNHCGLLQWEEHFITTCCRQKCAPPSKTHWEDPDKCFKCNCRLFGLESCCCASLVVCVGSSINYMPLWIYGRVFEPHHVSVRCRRVWTCTPLKESPIDKVLCSRVQANWIIHSLYFDGYKSFLIHAPKCSMCIKLDLALNYINNSLKLSWSDAACCNNFGELINFNLQWSSGEIFSLSFPLASAELWV